MSTWGIEYRQRGIQKDVELWCYPERSTRKWVCGSGAWVCGQRGAQGSDDAILGHREGGQRGTQVSVYAVMGHREGG